MLPYLIVSCLWFANCETPPESFSPEPVVYQVDHFSPEQEIIEAAERQVELAVHRGMGSDVEQWRPLVAGHFSDLGQEAVDMAMRIMACESGGNPHARNPRSTATGLMQIMASVWGPEFGFSREDLEVPETNLWVARQVYEIQGWQAWTCWRR